MRKILVSLLVAAVVTGVVGAWFYLSRGAKPVPQETPVTQVPQPGSICGMFHVSGTGEAVSGVQVEAYRWKPRRGDSSGATAGLVKAGDAVSLADGHFEISGLKPGSYLLARPETPGYQSEIAEDRIRVEVGPGERLDGLIFELLCGVSITGHVVDTKGKPIEGAEVRVWQRNAEPRVVFTGAQGEFTFEGADPGRHCAIEAVAMGFSCSHRNAHDDERLRTVGGNGISGIEFVLAPGRSFEGVLVDEAGQPIPDAYLHVDNACWASNVLTKADGRFLFVGLPDGTAETRMHGSVEGKSLKFLEGTETVRCGPGPHTKGVRLIAQPIRANPDWEGKNLHPTANMTTGRVVDPEGDPLNDIEVIVTETPRSQRHVETGPFFSNLTVSGPDGKFALDLDTEGEVTLTVSGKGIVSDGFEGIRAGSKDNVLEVRRSLPVSGIVRDAATGEPIRYFRVTMTFPGIGTTSERPLSAGTLSSETVYSSDGHFSVYSDMPKAIGIYVKAPGHAPAQQDVTFDRSGACELAQFSLQPERTITGIVVDSDGAPVEAVRVGAWVSENGAGYGSTVTRTGVDGRFVLGGLGAGVYRVLAKARDFVEQTTEVDLTQVATTDLRIILEKPDGIER